MNKATTFPWEFDGETISFETPEQTRVEYRVAPFGTRMVAALLDQCVIVAVTIGVFLAALIGIALLSASVSGGSGLYLVAFLVVFNFLFGLFYFVWAEVRGEGQTLGKRRMGIRTILMTGHGMTLGAALVRNLARIIDNLPPLWLVPAFTRGRRRLGDLLAGTVVVLVAAPRRVLESQIRWLAATRDEVGEREFYFSGEHIEKLYPDDLNLLEHMAERLHRAPRRQKDRAIAEVASRYVERLGMQEEAEHIATNPLRFLRELSVVLRERFEGQAY